MIMDHQSEVAEQVDQVALEAGVIKVDHVGEVVFCFGIGVNLYLYFEQSSFKLVLYDQALWLIRLRDFPLGLQDNCYYGVM